MSLQGQGDPLVELHQSTCSLRGGGGHLPLRPWRGLAEGSGSLCFRFLDDLELHELPRLQRQCVEASISR